MGDIPAIEEERPDLRKVIQAGRRDTSVGKRVVIVRRPCNGLGDLVDILAGIQGIVDNDPETQVHLRSISPISTIAERHPAIFQIHTTDDTLPQKPVEVLDVAGVCPAKRIEMKELRPSRDRIAIFAHSMGVDYPGTPRIYLGYEELAWAKNWLLSRFETSSDFVALVWRTRTPYKNYANISDLYHRLRCSQNVVVVEFQDEVPGVNTNGLSIREQAAILSHAKLVITGDTGWLHVAGALQRPIFGLYGSQNPVTRQGAFNVPGGWISGPCPHGRQPCWERTCHPVTEIPPCLKFQAVVAEQMILETLEVLKTPPAPGPKDPWRIP